MEVNIVILVVAGSALLTALVLMRLRRNKNLYKNQAIRRVATTRLNVSLSYESNFPHPRTNKPVTGSNQK